MGMLEPIILVVVVSGVAWILFSGRFEFRVRISRGSLKLITGKVTHDSLSQLKSICTEYQIKRGWIGGVRRGRRLQLTFSRSVPPGCRQQIRNMWENR
jgi:Protein of unknown function (DUF3634)